MYRLYAALFITGVGFLLPLPSLWASTNSEVETLETTYKFENDGTGQVTVRAKWKALTNAGARELSEIAIPYVSEFEEVRVTSFETLKKNGSVLQGDPKQVFEATPPAIKAVPVFSGAKLKQFVLPNLESGDEMQFEYSKVIQKPEKPGDFWALHLPTKGVPVDSEVVTLDIPADRKISFHFNSSVPHKTSQAGGRRIDTWEFKNLEPIPAAETPDPIFAVSTLVSWDILGEWLDGLNRESEQVTPEIQALAQTLTAGKSSSKEKIDAIYTYVSEKVRYVSISFGLGRIQPHRAADVLRNAYGDCKDKHALFAALLHAAGVNSGAVLSYPGIGVLAPEVPIPTQFVHEFTAIQAGSERQFRDTTLELAEPGLLMTGVAARPALLIAEGHSKIIDLPAASVPERTKAILSASIPAAGHFSGRNHIECTGQLALALRRVFRDGTAEQQQAVLKGISGIELYAANIKDVRHNDPGDLLHPFAIDYGIEEDSFMPGSETSKRITFYVGNPLETKALLEMKRPHKPFPLPSRDAGRSIDLAIDTAFMITNRMPVHLQTKFGSYDSTSSYESGHLRIQRTFTLSGIMVQPAEWESFLQYVAAISSDELQGFTLERNAQGARPVQAAGSGNPQVNALLRSGSTAEKEGRFAEAQKDLEEATRLDPNNPYAWNELGLVYLGENQLDKAEQAFKRQIEINPRDLFAHNNLGRVYLRKHRLEEAIKEFQQQLEINPQDQFSDGNLAMALSRQSKWPDTAAHAKKATEINPKNAMGWVLLGRAQSKMGQLALARDSLNRALQESDNTTIQNDVAYDLADAGMDLDKAWQLASSALTVETATICKPDNLVEDEKCTARFSRLASTLDTVGWVLAKQGKFQAAAPYMLSAYAISPRWDVALHLAVIDTGLGKTDDALRLYGIARRMQGFANSDAAELRNQLAKQIGGEAAVDSRLSSLEPALLAPGLILPSPVQKLPSGTCTALVSGEGVIQDIQCKAMAAPSPAELTALKNLKLLPISWPDHALASVRTIEIHAESGDPHLVAFVVRPTE